MALPVGVGFVVDFEYVLGKRPLDIVRIGVYDLSEELASVFAESKWVVEAESAVFVCFWC